MTAHHLHLVSDSTGETISTVARACLVQFSGVEPIEHVWSLVRTPGMMTKVMTQIEAHPGPVLYTLVNRELRDQLTATLESVPELYRRVLVAVLLEGRTPAVVAEELGLKPDTVRKQLQRGTEQWRQVLGSDPMRFL